MHVELLTVGNELLSGTIVDTNAAWVMQRLYAFGVRTARKVTVPDDVDLIAEALLAAAARADVLVVSGGLGPTEDDVTAEAAARAAGVALQEDPVALAQLSARLAGAGIPVTDRQKRQARMPEGAEVIENRRGTAPAFRLGLGRCSAFFLPGPPPELKPLVEEAVVPFVLDRLGGAPPFATRTLETFGTIESRLGDRVGEVLPQLTGVEVGYQVVYPEIHLRLRASGADAGEAARRLDHADEVLTRHLGPVVFGRDGQSFPEVLGEALAGAGRTLALAESCTGGLAAGLVTDVPGSSRYLVLSAVTYANEAKTRILGVDPELLAEHGAVSEPCALAMAEGARLLASSDYAVSITGIAGPGGGTDDKPVGTVFIALATPDGQVVARRHRFRGDRGQIRRLSAFVALDAVRRHVLGLAPSGREAGR